MVSRPVVAATLGWWLAGDPATGALIGLILEALHLTVLPVGAARYPEGGPAALATGAMVAATPPSAATVLAGVLFALSWAWVGGVSIRKLREFNVRLVAVPPDAPDLPARLQRRHLLGIAVDFARGAALVATAVPLLAGLLAVTAAGWGLDDRVTWAVLWSAAAAGVAATLRLFGERRVLLFVVGAVGGTLALLAW
jgi:hypothetical protein